MNFKWIMRMGTIGFLTAGMSLMGTDICRAAVVGQDISAGYCEESTVEVSAFPGSVLPSEPGVSEEEKNAIRMIRIENGNLNGSVFSKGDRIRFSLELAEDGFFDYMKKLDYSYGDDGTDVHSFDRILVRLQSEKGQKAYVSLACREMDGKTAAEGVFEVPSGMASGKWKILCLSINESGDESGLRLYNRTITHGDFYPDLSWGDFTIAGSKADLEAPVVKSLKAVKNPDGSVTYSFKASDKSRYFVNTGYPDNESLKKDVKNGRYTVTQSKKKVKQKAVKNIYLHDIWGNQRVLRLSWPLDKSTVLANSAIRMTSVKLAKKNVKAGEDTSVTLKMKWTKFAPKKITLEYRSAYSAGVALIKMKASDAKKMTWMGTFKAKKSMEDGMWTLVRIHIEGKNSLKKNVEMNLVNKKWLTDYVSANDINLRIDLENGNIRVRS